MKKYFLGIDIGTYETKGVLCDSDGCVAATAKRKHEVIMPCPGFAEHDAEVWWSEFCVITQELIETSGLKATEIAAVGCSAVACGLVAIDENLNPLCNAILYGIDRRSLDEIQELNDLLGEKEIVEFCGEGLSVESYGPKLRWLKNHKEEIYKKAKYFTFSQGFINLRLTGKNRLDYYSTAFAMPMYNYRTQDWDDRMCAVTAPREKLPQLCHAQDVIGTVTQWAAKQTGLPAGIPVVCGTTDAASEALSVGITSPGDTMVMYGSSIFVVHVTDRLVVKDNPLWKSSYLLPNQFSILAGMATAGSITRWLLNVFGTRCTEQETHKGVDQFAQLFEGVDTIPAGSEGLMVLPYFAGERMPIHDPLAKGVFFGLTLAHTREHIVRACLEGIGYGLAQNLDIIKGMGFHIREITAIGGGTKNPSWMQIMSDITGLAHRIYKCSMGASYGNAMLAAMGSGTLDVDAIKTWNKTDYIIMPNKDKEQFYNSQKEKFRQLYENNRSMMHI